MTPTEQDKKLLEAERTTATNILKGELRKAVEKCFTDNDMTDSGEPTHFDDIELFDTEQVVTDLVELIRLHTNKERIDELNKIPVRIMPLGSSHHWYTQKEFNERIAQLESNKESNYDTYRTR